MKHPVQFFAALFLVFPFFTSCFFSGKPIYGNHQLVNQRIDIDNYESVVLKIPGEVYYQQFSDSAPYLQIHTDENIIKSLDVKVENNQLVIEVKKDSIIRPSELVIYTSSHELSQAEITGSCKFHLNGEVNAKDLKMNITGSGKILADSLLCNNFTVEITGSGDVQLTGACNQSSYSITGSGNIHAFNFLVQELSCRITGAGNIEAAVTKKLDVNLTGAGNISYHGSPQSINQKITGSGKVVSLN